MTTSSASVSSKTTIKVGLSPAESSLTRIVIGKKRPAEKKTEPVKVRIAATENGDSRSLLDDVCREDPMCDGSLPPESLPRKRRELLSDDFARQQLINKILTESSKKLKKKAGDTPEAARQQRQSFHARPDPPCVKVVQRREGTFLTVPSAIDVRKLLNSAIPRSPRVIEPCSCGQQSKYRDPRTGVRFCSVHCFRRLQASSSTVGHKQRD